MAKLQKIGSIFIRIYPGDHLPPHFHAVGPERSAKIEIVGFVVMKSSLRTKELKAVIQWAKKNETLLITEWNRVTRHPIAWRSDRDEDEAGCSYR